MLLIYSHKITPRFMYTMKQVLTKILGIEIGFTTKVEDFIKHTGAKITYTKQPLQNEFFVRGNDLLFEQGINDITITIGNWDDVPCFFPAGDRSNVPFDIFSASFYLLSRYEEYLPHVKDMHGRFSPKDSIAYKHQFLHRPVVDIWAYKFMGHLLQRFPDLSFKKRQFGCTSIVDVTASHCFAHRGLVRSVAGLCIDLAAFRLNRIWQRIAVWFNAEKDPYNNYATLIDVHRRFTIKSVFFFQFASYSTYDKNVSPTNNRFRFLIKTMADYSAVALAASYSSFSDTQLLKSEKKSLAAVVNRPVTAVRMRYNRVDLPITYRNLVEAEFTDDYTMGYTHEIGFRAGTCTTFQFYDINLEIPQPIRVHPFAIHDYALQAIATEKAIFELTDPIYQEVKKVNGELILVFSNELIGSPHTINWLTLYTTFMQKYHV